MTSLRNPDLVQPDELREVIRGNLEGFPMPSARDGFIVEDLDLILRWKGPRYALDSVGRFRLIEVKQPGYGLTGGQEWTFLRCIVPILLQSAESWRFDGFFLVNVDKNYSVPSKNMLPALHPESIVSVRGADGRHQMDVGQFLAWCACPFSPFPGIEVKRGPKLLAG